MYEQMICSQRDKRVINAKLEMKASRNTISELTDSPSGDIQLWTIPLTSEFNIEMIIHYRHLYIIFTNIHNDGVLKPGSIPSVRIDEREGTGMKYEPLGAQ